MRILFIGNNRIGDFILSSGLLAHLIETCPDARLTVVCGRGALPLLAEIPRVERIIVLEKRSFHRHWFDLWRQVVGTRWDLVVDLRNSAVSRLIAARTIHRLRRSPGRKLHRVEETGLVLGLDPPPAPKVWFGPAERAEAAGLVPNGPPVLAIAPGSTHEAKRWPAERFAELAQRLTGPGGILPDGRIAVIGAPNERPVAEPVLAAVEPERRIDLMSNTPLLVAAACLDRCALYIGNDGGLMHLAAAVGVPTLGLFGPTPAHHYRPWGRHADFVQTATPFETLSAIHQADPKAPVTLMDSLPVDTVETAARALWARMRSGA